MTELAKEMGFEYTKVFPGFHGSCVYKGRQYGFPIGGQVNVVYINKNVFRKYGVPIPTKKDWTWPEFIEVAKKVTVKRTDGPGYECFGWQGSWAVEIIRQYGGHSYSPDGTRCLLDSPEAIAGTKMLLDTIFTHHIAPTPSEDRSIAVSSDVSGGLNQFAMGKFAMTRSGRWRLPGFRRYYDAGPGDTEEPLEITVLPMPRAPGRPPLSLGGARTVLVSTNAPSILDACKFLKYVASESFNREVARTANGISPVAEFARQPGFLENKSYPQEDFHDVFVEQAQYVVGKEISAFIHPTEHARIANYEFEKGMHRFEENPGSDTLQVATEMMQTITRRINAQIQKNIQRNKKLKAEYEQALAKSNAEGR